MNCTVYELFAITKLLTKSLYEQWGFSLIENKKDRGQSQFKTICQTVCTDRSKKMNRIKVILGLCTGFLRNKDQGLLYQTHIHNPGEKSCWSKLEVERKKIAW